MAGIALGVTGGSSKETFGHWFQVEFILDSGSSRTTIGETVAQRLGVNVNQLPLSIVGGVTGIAQRPFLPDVDLWFLGDEFKGVRVAGVTILRTLREERQRQGAGLRQRTIAPTPAPNLLGTDAMEGLGACAVLDFRSKAGHIQW